MSRTIRSASRRSSKSRAVDCCEQGSRAAPLPAENADGFQHEAFLYSDEDEFLGAVAAFVGAGLAAEEPVLVALTPERNDLVRAALETDAASVRFVDLAEVGRNPARIIPVWRAFVDAARPRRVRGIGGPVRDGRSDDENLEWRLHELLLNLAFADVPGWRLLCLYDASGLDEAGVELALETHPLVREDGVRRASAEYRLPAGSAPLEAPLPEPSGASPARPFDGVTLPDVRVWAGARASAAGLPAERASDLALAAHEVAANSVRYGGGNGLLRSWSDNSEVVVEVSDAGHLDDMLAGRVEPGPDTHSGRGLWLANHLCDLVQLRSGAFGTVVRLHMQT